MTQPATQQREQPITTLDELREALHGEPNYRSATKERTRLHARDRDWIAASPFCVIATSSLDGSCDNSPKGDPTGHLALVLDDTTLVIPERAGNKRADGYRNILENPHVGLIFLVPGRNETLRVNGRARLVSDAPYFDDLVVKGHRPVLAVVVDIEQIFFHCGKAFLRSELWHPESWHPEALPSHACLVKDVQEIPETVEELEAYYRPENYNKGLYPTD
jgi:PPOX class probable FMN-dependent enzyme